MNGKPPQPNFYLTEEGYKALVRDGNWKINEIPLNIAAQIKDHFGIDTSFCLCASGISTVPSSSGENVPIAGIDWIRRENNPRANEKPLNIYHYMITQPTSGKYPVFDLGKEHTVAPHWAELEDLKVYFQNWK